MLSRAEEVKEYYRAHTGKAPAGEKQQTADRWQPAQVSREGQLQGIRAAVPLGQREGTQRCILAQCDFFFPEVKNGQRRFSRNILEWFSRGGGISRRCEHQESNTQSLVKRNGIPSSTLQRKQ